MENTNKTMLKLTNDELVELTEKDIKAIQQVLVDIIKDLDNIVDLFENDGFSNVIIESKVKCDEKGIKRLEQIKKMNNVIFI